MREVVCDASVVVAMLLASGSDGRWAAQQLGTARLIAPSLMMFEAGNIIRRSEAAGLISPADALAAHQDLLELSVEAWPYDLVGTRVWALRANLTSYDASYVAVAEAAQAPLVTLDRRVGRAPAIRCQVLTP